LRDRQINFFGRAVDESNSPPRLNLDFGFVQSAGAARHNPAQPTLFLTAILIVSCNTAFELTDAPPENKFRSRVPF
jgi:hypothetical protein